MKKNNRSSRRQPESPSPPPSGTGIEQAPQKPQKSAKPDKPKLVTVHGAMLHPEPAEGDREEIEEALQHEDERLHRKAA